MVKFKQQFGEFVTGFHSVKGRRGQSGPGARKSNWVVGCHICLVQKQDSL